MGREEMIAMTASTLAKLKRRILPARIDEPAWPVALLFPWQGHWTEEDYFALDTNRLVELSDGCLEVLPLPTPFHQLVAQFLYRLVDREGPALGADLAMEVVSKGKEDRKRDLITKRFEYARAGIPEYWIVDPQTRRITLGSSD
jgi:Uma2 family endonuclease